MWLPLTLRCVLGNIGFVSLTYSFKHLPLSIGTVIISTSPFAVAIMASLFLNERVLQADIIAIFVSFTGIFVMTLARKTDKQLDTTHGEYVFAIVVAVFTMLVVATVAVCARFMKKIHYSVIQTHNGLFGVVFVGILLAFNSYSNEKKPYIFDNPSTYFWIVLGGLINSGAQNLMVITM